MDKPVWEKPNPVKKSTKLSPMQKARARARARAAGRSYPNMVDNIWAARTANEEFDLKRLGSNPGKFKRLVAKHLGAAAAEKIDGADGTRIMNIAKRKGDTALFRKGSFIKNFYGEAYEEGSKEIRVAYARMTPGQTPFVLGLDKDVPQDNARELRRRRAKKIYRAYFDEANEGKTLGKPFRTPGEKKKFAVYVRNDRGNVVKVRFGDPNLSIKRDNPARRKSFRARHNCANPGPRTKARYWSCRQWRASAKVEA